jgi:hypothetical protein
MVGDYWSYSTWEGSEQRGQLTSGADACAEMRTRTTYVPMTGSEMLSLFRKIHPEGLPTQLEQAAAASGSLFADRTFLIGIQLRTPTQDILGQIGAARDLRQAADAIVEDAAIIWAPGRGTSIRNMLVTGEIDMSAMMTMMGELLPQMWGQWMQQLPQVLPGLLPGLFPGGTIPGSLFGHQTATKSLAPGSADTGLPITDDVGSSQDTSDPLVPSPRKSTLTGPIAAVAGVGLGALLVWWAFQQE